VHTRKQQARTAGVLYLLMALIGPFGLLYVPSQLVVQADPAATASRIRAAEGLLRTGIASDLVHQILAVFLVLALYRLFRPVHEGWARQVVILGALLSVPIMFANTIYSLAALLLITGSSPLPDFSQTQLDSLGFLFIRLHEYGITLASIFWGLWLVPFGRLVIQSRFIPRALGFLLLAAGLGYLVAAFAPLILPAYAARISQIVAPLHFGELPIILYLAIWGAREHTAPENTTPLA